MQCSYYWVINPLPKRITDNESRIPSLEHRIKYKGKEYNIAVLSDRHGRPEVIRLIIPELPQKEIPEDLLPFIRSMGEHMLTVLRLGYDPRISLFDIRFWTFHNDGSSPRADIEMDFHYKPVFHATAVRDLFAASLKHREEFRLLSNGANEGIPVQYRFLSLYKLIEMKFRQKGKWKEEELRKVLSSFALDFQSKGISDDPLKAIHYCRDKCAHIRTGKNREVLGVSELNHKEALFVTKILPVMTKIAAEILSEQTSGHVTFQTVDRGQLWDDQAIHHLLEQHNVPNEARIEFQNLYNDLKTDKKGTLLKRANEWMAKNQGFLGDDATIIRKALGILDVA